MYALNELREFFLRFIASIIWPRGYMVKKYQDLLFLIKWKSDEGKQLAWYGGYEKAQADFLLSNMSKGCNAFFDIGANFGLYSLQVAQSGRAAAVHAFEPHPERFAHMEGNLYLNKLTEAVKMHQLSVSDKTGTLLLDLGPETTIESRVLPNGNRGISVKASALDELFNMNEKSLFFRIDADGRVLETLRGAARLLGQNFCFMQIKASPEEAAEVLSFMKELGYEHAHQIEKHYYFKKTAAAEQSVPRKAVGPIDKNIVMCLTTGRSGSNFLEHLLSIADDTCSLHEPEPAFQNVLEDVKSDPEAALNFVYNRKLPDILSRPEKNYVETSHLFGKGFFEAFIELKIPFKLIILNRNPRDVAKSFWRINVVPLSKSGRNWTLEPGQRDVLSPKGWQSMSAYQLCYWYCLEIERRKTLYKKKCQELGIPVVETSIKQLKNWDHFQQLCAACGLSLTAGAKEAYDRIISHKVNEKKKHSPKLSILPFAWQEEKVWQALGVEGIELKKEVEARYGGSR